MRIAIDSIPEEGRVVTVQLAQGWASDVATYVLEVPVEDLGGELRVVLRGRSLRCTGALHASGTRTCERCGEDVHVVLEADVDLSYVPVEDFPSGGSEIRLAAGDLDVGWYRDGVLDMADVVSEALALQLPPRIACLDVAACDARVEALLVSSVEGAGSSSPFAVLSKLQ